MHHQNQHQEQVSAQYWLRWYDRLLSMEKKAPSTRLSYLSALKRWCATVKHADSPSQADLHAWLRDRRHQVSQARINQEICAIKGFYHRAYQLSLMGVNYAEIFPKQRRIGPKLPKTLNEWQIGRLLAAPDLKTPVGFRDMCIMRMIFETGMRANELIKLNVSDIWHERALINIAGKRARISAISADMTALLQRWIEHRKTLKPGKGLALFVTARGRPFTHSRRIWRICARYAPAMGANLGVCDLRKQHTSGSVWGRAGPNTLRNTFITALIASGCDIRFIQAMLGLASAADIERYLPVDIERLKREHAKHFKPLDDAATWARRVNDSDPP